MKKKLIAGVIIFLILGMSSTVCHANNASNRYYFEVLGPKQNTVTTDKNTLLSFRASRGTNVRIRVYHYNGTRYTPISNPIDITVGALQRGWASVDLGSGSNKIQFTARYRNGSEANAQRIVNVLGVTEVKQLLRDMVNKSTLGMWRK